MKIRVGEIRLGRARATPLKKKCKIPLDFHKSPVVMYGAIGELGFSRRVMALVPSVVSFSLLPLMLRTEV
jgi:hypothetical protein